MEMNNEKQIQNSDHIGSAVSVSVCVCLQLNGQFGVLLKSMDMYWD